MFYIHKDLSNKVLFLGVSKHTKGGMTAVLVSYDKYIEGMRFIPTWKLGNKLVKSCYALQAIIRMTLQCLCDKRIEIVHIHGAANASFDRCKIFIKLAKRFHKKVILHEHAADFREYYDQAVDKKGIVDTIRQCDLLIVLSQSWKEYFVSIGVPEEKIKVLNNPVSPPEVLPRQKDDKLHLLYMGEISKRKGGFDLLKAVSDHRQELEGKLLLRMGGNEVDGDIKAYIHGHQLENIVSYEGWIAGRKKVECLNWEDVYILPSYNEGLPIAILEAMSYSHPVISTPVGGIPEIIKDGVDGMLVTPGDTEAIYHAIQWYIDHKEDIAVEGKQSYRMVKPFLPESVFSDLSTIYKDLLHE